MYKKEKINPKIIRIVKENICNYFPDTFRLEDNLDIIIKKRIIQSYSDFYKIMITNGGNRKYIWVKVKKNHPIDVLKEDTQQQYDDLVKLWKVFKPVSYKFTIPRPLGCYADIFTHVTEELPGEKLDSYLRFGNPFIRHSKKNLLEIIRMCGEWLGFFHTLNPITERKLNIKNILNKKIKKCIDLGLNQKIGEELTSKLFDNFDRFVSKDNQSMIHNDYSPHNILIHYSQIGVIDFVELSQGSIYQDLASFLTWIDALHFIPPYTQNLTKLLRQAFLEGYCNYKKIDFEHLDFFMVISVINYIADLPKGNIIERVLLKKRLSFFFKYLEKAIES